MIKNIKDAWQILNKDDKYTATWASEYEKVYEFYVRGKGTPAYIATGLTSFLVSKKDGGISAQYIFGDYSPLGKEIRGYTEKEIKEIES